MLTANNFAKDCVLVVQVPGRFIQDEELRPIGGRPRISHAEHPSAGVGQAGI